MLSSYIRAALALAFASVDGMRWAGLQPTLQAANLAIEGRSPIPTGLAARYDPAHIFRRQDETRTCGYVDANYNDAATCSPGYYCAKNDINGAFGCCSGALDVCTLATTCYDKAAVIASCDEDCLNNGYNEICTYGTDTACYYYVFELGPTSVTNYGCGPDEYTSFVYSTYTNLPDTPEPTLIISFVTVTPAITSSPTPSPTSSPTIISTQSPNPTVHPTPPKKAPIGAIVGGVVGGLAVISAVVFGILLLVKKKRSSAPTDGAGNVLYYSQAPQQYAQQPIKTHSVYVTTDSKSAAMSPLQPKSPAMSPPMSPAPPYAQIVPQPAMHTHQPLASNTMPAAFEAP